MKEDLKDIPIYELSGSHRKMGQDFGEACREQIHELYEVRLANALEHASDRGRMIEEDKAVLLAEECLKYCQHYCPEGYDEFLGICEGAKISAAKLYICQGLTDFRDYLSWGELPDGYGCTSLIVPRERSKNESILLGQTWDLQTTNMPFVCIVKRSPLKSPKTVYMTTTGGLALIGMNEHGLSIGTNNIKCRDSRLGVHYLFVIHKFLQQSQLSEGETTIREAYRSGAHYYFYADENSYNGLECSATQYESLNKDPFIYHSNHCLHENIKKLECEYSGKSSDYRYLRIKELLHQNKKLSKTTIKNLLSDKTGDDLAVNRYHFNGISSNGCVIMEPGSRKFLTCRTQADQGIWKEIVI